MFTFPALPAEIAANTRILPDVGSTCSLPWASAPFLGAVRRLFTEIAENRRKSDEQFDDFLQVLMDGRYKDGKPLTNAEITGIMVGTLLGGQHTSNVTGELGHTGARGATYPDSESAACSARGGDTCLRTLMSA